MVGHAPNALEKGWLAKVWDGDGCSAQRQQSSIDRWLGFAMRELQQQQEKLHRQHAWNDCPLHAEKRSEAYEETSSAKEQNHQLSTINKEKEEIAHHD